MPVSYTVFFVIAFKHKEQNFQNDYILLGILKIHLSYVLYMLSVAMT